jgi:hypothetical protein
MCKILNISRQTYYYQAKPIENESDLEEIVQEEFIRNRKGLRYPKIEEVFSKVWASIQSAPDRSNHETPRIDIYLYDRSF